MAVEIKRTREGRRLVGVNEEKGVRQGGEGDGTGRDREEKREKAITTQFSSLGRKGGGISG